MIRFIRVLTCLITILHSSSSWTAFECNYKGSGEYHVLKSIYFCSVSNDPNILNKESAQISSINGEHIGSKSYDDVIGFDARRKKIQVFPRGLHTYFKNLKVIYIENCGLVEIHQAELKPFPNLIYFFLSTNSIEVIEEGLFDNNPNLEAIGMWESKIIHIDSKVFDNLSNLRYFWFSQTPCVKKDIWNSKEKVKEALILVKNQCTSADFRVQSEKMKILENEMKNLNSDEIKEKIESFEKTFNNSQFSKFRPLKNKLESLKNPKNVSLVKKEVPSVDLVSKVHLEVPEKCSNVPNFDTVYKNLSNAMKDDFDQIKVSLNEIKGSKKCNFEIKLSALVEKLVHVDEKLTKVDEKMTSFNGKLENFEEKLGHLQEQFTDFEVKNSEKYYKFENELVNTRHKINMNFDEKIKGIEKRLIKKFEEILDEKLGKVFQF